MAESSGENKESTVQTIANLLVRTIVIWANYKKTGTIHIEVEFEKGAVVNNSFKVSSEETINASEEEQNG